MMYDNNRSPDDKNLHNSQNTVYVIYTLKHQKTFKSKPISIKYKT
jgi:hypothetical protein